MSNLINKTRLQKFAEGFWTKIKGRYDKAFKEATISGSESADKKITLTRLNDQTEEISLADYARLQDRNEFKKDVSVDNVGSINNLYLGNVNGNESQNRILGHRDITSKSFVDGYVSDLVILANSELQNRTETSWRIWAIKKGATKEQDEVLKIYHTASATKTLPVETMTLNGAEQKVVKLAINEKFADEVYFMYQCISHKVKVIHPQGIHLNDNVINMSQAPGNNVGATIQWNTNATNNTGISYLYGRESIGSLAEKLKQTQADGSLYVLKSETTATGGQANAGKVAKLDQAGKLDATMLPAIAINEYFTATDFTHAALSQLTFQNGDVVVVTKSNKVKRYLCVDKEHNADNLINAFVELNDKSGVVTGVEGRTGNVTLALETTDDKFRLKINGDGGAEVVKELDIISEDEINTIINSLN